MLLLRSGVSLRPIVALTLAVGVTAGGALPSAAAVHDWFPFFGRNTPEEPVPDPLPYTVAFTVSGGDRRLERQLRAASSLVERQKSPASGLVGLIARARQDMSRFVAVLYEHALYGAEVFITIDGRPIETLDPFVTVTTRPVPVTITIVPGPPFVFGTVNAAPLPPALTLYDLGLVPGATAGSAVILRAETRIADGWRQHGHPLVAVFPRDTVADHRTNTLDVAISVDPGPQAVFGRVMVDGAAAVRPDLVVARSGIEPGVLFSSTITRRAETRLRELGVFESVRILPADYLDPDGSIPVTIVVVERKPRVIGGSVNYSNTEGLGLEVFWRHRNLFGGAEQLQLTASVSRLLAGAFDPDYRLAGTFRKPAVIGPMTDLTLRLEGYRETTDAYRVTAVEAEVGLFQTFSDTLTGSIDLEVERSETVAAMETEDHLVTTLTGKLHWDTRDNRLDPTKGINALFSGAPAYDFIENAPFATFSTDVSAYRAFGEGDRFVLAGRVAVATLVVDDIDNVAPNRRLYAGGAGSVRGYAYQNIGPRDINGDPTGGRSSLIMSAELRYRLNEQFGLVAFVDAGNANESILPTLDNLKFGVGGGVRYLTPVGPIRLDVAVPLQPESGDPSVAVYVGIGQAF
jgi:translocation and assembly module TamA